MVSDSEAPDTDATVVDGSVHVREHSSTIALDSPQVLVSPIGDRAAVPSLQANRGHGEFFDGEALTFETTRREFTDRGEGVRNTISWMGHGSDAHGSMHWSANFDEVPDVEGDIRGPCGGFGLLADADFEMGTGGQSLRDPQAGISPDLDVLAAYVSSLTAVSRSPFRSPSGEVTSAAPAGQALFESSVTACTDCHLVRGSPIAASCLRALPCSTTWGGPRVGIDPPTLHGAWNTAPDLRDGSAATLRDVLDGNDGSHGQTTTLTDEQTAELVACPRSLDGPAAPIPAIGSIRLECEFFGDLTSFLFTIWDGTWRAAGVSYTATRCEDLPACNELPPPPWD